MSVTLTRKELYDRVWEEPVDTLAKEYGLSNVGLGKACRRHEIPVPPRGYWARKAAGQKPRRQPLPPAKNGNESVNLLGSGRPDTPLEEPERAVHPLIAFELEAENKIVVPEDLRVKHPAIAQTKAYWAAQSRGDREPEHGEDKELPASVRLTDAPMTRNGYDEARLAVDIPEAVVLPYELIADTRSHRCFMVPAFVVNAHGKVSRLKE